MASGPNPSFYAASQPQQQQQQRYLPNNLNNGQFNMPDGMPNGAGSPGHGAPRMPSQGPPMQAMGRSMSPHHHQLQPHQMAQLQQLPPHLQAQMLAAMAAANSNGAPMMQQQQASSTPTGAPYRAPSVGPQAMAKPPFPMDEQQQQFLQQQKARTASLNPAQMQAFMQAQSQAQAQMQAQAQAQGSSHSGSPQQRNISPVNPGYNAALPQQGQLQQPPQMQYPQNMQPQPRLSNQFSNLAASQTPGWQPPFAPATQQQQQQQSRPATGDSPFRQDQTFSNAVAGPSNLNRGSPVVKTEGLSLSGPLGAAMPLPPFPNGLNGMPTAQGNAHMRRPSTDQMALMQRLTTLAQKPGGLPIQSLFTRTSWETLNSIEPVASTSAAGETSEEGRDRKRKAFEPPPPIPEYTAQDRRNLEGWMKKDLRAVELAKREQSRMKETLDDLGQDILNAQDWLGPPKLVTASPGGGKRASASSDGKGYRIRNKKERTRELAKGKRKTRPWLEYSKKQLREIAQVEECLIPIRLDIEHDGRKLNDTFTWNLNGMYSTSAAASYC